MSSDDAVTAALQKARYNETVHLTVKRDDEDGAPNESICLIPCLNEQQGGVQFNNLVELVRQSSMSMSTDSASSLQTDQDIVLSRELRTNRWFFPMLNDHRRNELYQKAIEAASQSLVNQTLLCTKKSEDATVAPIRVFDIGSGTGLLSMMAARSFQKLSVPVHVTSMEMSSAFCVLATRTVHDNALSDVILVTEGHSTAVTLEYTADLCISELLEDGLLGEGWLPAIRDAWERHLNPDAIVLPRGARVYAVIVQADWLPSYAGPYKHQFPQRHSSESHHHVSFSVDEKASECLIDAKLVVLPVHAEKLIRDGAMRVLSDPIELFDFNVSCREQIPGPEGRQRTVSVTVNVDAEAHGALVWWELDLWEGIMYSTEPGKEPWQDHWHPCLHLFNQKKNVGAGESVELKVKHNDSRIFVEFAASSDREKDVPPLVSSSKRVKVVYDNPVAALVSPERAFQLNSGERLDAYYQAMESALLKHRARSGDNSRSNAVVLDVSDFALGACIAAALGAGRVISLESSSGELPLTAARVAQLGNRIVPVPGQFDFEILQCYAEQLTLDVLGGSTVIDIIFSEPYYEILEGWHLQEALNFYYTVRLLRSNGLLSDQAVVIPSVCRIMGCIIESEQLRSAYCACGCNMGSKDGIIRGLDHSFVNQMGNHFHEFDLSIPIWQYDFTALSEVVELGALTYGGHPSPPSTEESFVRTSFHTAGRCDALLVWLEYVFPSAHPINVDAESYTLGSISNTSVLSTNNQSHRQIVRMLKEPSRCDIEVHETERAEFRCTSRFGGVTGSDDHQFNIRIIVDG